jgi:hypothetical protein
MGIFKKSQEKIEKEQLKKDIIGFCLLQAKDDVQGILLDNSLDDEPKEFFQNLLKCIYWVISEDYPNIDNNPIKKPQWQRK